MQRTELYTHKPSSFKPNILVAGGFLKHEDSFLLLQRHPEKSFGLHWNLPAGKVEEKEDPQLAAQREIYEETGIFIPLEALRPLHTFYIQRDPYAIQFHVYHTHFGYRPKLNLKMDENIDARWLNEPEAHKLPLIGGGKEIIAFCLKNAKSWL